MIILISEHFPPNYKYIKTFHKNTMKLTYSCIPNMKSTINGHNKKYYSLSLQDNKNYATELLKNITQ